MREYLEDGSKSWRTWLRVGRGIISRSQEDVTMVDRYCSACMSRQNESSIDCGRSLI